MIKLISHHITLGFEENHLKNRILHIESELSGRRSHALETSARTSKSSRNVKAIKDLVECIFIHFKHEHLNMYVDDIQVEINKI